MRGCSDNWSNTSPISLVYIRKIKACTARFLSCAFTSWILTALLMSQPYVPLIDIHSELLHAQWHGYLEVSSLALVLWDYTLTLDGELKLIWKKSGRSWPIVLFAVNRYMAIVAQVINSYSHIGTNVSYSLYVLTHNYVTSDFHRSVRFVTLRFRVTTNMKLPGKFAIAYWLVGTSIAQLMVTDGIVWFCVCALYGHAKKIRYPLLALFIITICCSTSVMGVVGSKSHGTAEVVPGFKRCIVYTPYHNMWLFWLPIIIYESATLSLVLRQFYIYVRYRGQWISSLMEMMLKDMLLYLAIIFALFITNAVLFASPDPSIAGILSPPTLVLLSIMGNRMLLNLRAEEKSSANGGKTTSEELTTVRFAPADP